MLLYMKVLPYISKLRVYILMTNKNTENIKSQYMLTANKYTKKIILKASITTWDSSLVGSGVVI